MSQDLYFYKQKVFLEETSQLLSQVEVHNAIKTCLANRDLEKDSQLREKLFEEVDLDIDISAYSKEIELLLEKTEFLRPDSKCFMVNDKMWKAIQKNILFQHNQQEDNQKIEQADDSKLDELFNELCRQSSCKMLSNYQELEKLFRKNLLFANII